MKKICILSALFSASAAFATTTQDIYGGSSGRTSFVSGDYDLVLHANQTDPTVAKFHGQSSTVRSIITFAEDNPTLWNIAYGATVDIKQSTGTFTAFKNTGKAEWRIGGLEIKNSTAGDAVANVDIGTLSLVVNTPSTEASTLKISTDANVSGTSLSLYNAGSFEVANNATVNYTVAQTSVNSGGSFIVNSGSTLITSVNLNLASAANLTVAGAFKYTSASNLILSGNVNVSGSAEAKSVAKTFITGNVNFGANSSYTARGAIQISTGTLTVADTSSVILADETSIYTGRIIMNGGTLNLDGVNVFTRDYTANPLVNIVALGAGSVVNVNATNKFANLHFSADSSITFNLSDDASDILFFKSIAGSPSSSYLTINDFADSRIFLVSADAFAQLNATINTADGKTYSAADMDFVADTYDGVSGYWLKVAVPEPSEWAAIFGVLALFLALRRRR